MLLYLRTSKGDINTQNTGTKIGEIVDGTTGHYRWAFPDSLEPYEIRRSQSEELGNDVGNMLLAVKVREDDDRETDMCIGIDGSFYQNGQKVLDVSDIENIVTAAVAKLASTCPFPVGTAFLIDLANTTHDWFDNNGSNLSDANVDRIVNLLKNQYLGTTWETYETRISVKGQPNQTFSILGIRRTA